MFLLPLAAAWLLTLPGPHPLPSGAATLRVQAMGAETLPNFANRAAFVLGVEGGLTAPAGSIARAGQETYVATPGDRSILDLPGWRPEPPTTPEHFGAVGDGQSDDTRALTGAFATGTVALRPGRTYGFTSLDVPKNSTVTGSGAELRYLGKNGKEPVLVIGAGTSWEELHYSAGAQTVGGAGSIQFGDDVHIGVLELEADTQMDALAVSVIGDRVYIGEMRSRKFGRPLSIGYTTKPLHGFYLGWFDFESIVRGIAMRDVSDFVIDGGRQSGRSPKKPNEKPGRNNLLLSGISNGRFGPMDLGDAPEHSIRFGGGGKQAPLSLSSENIVFAPLTIRRASASAIKLNPGVSARVRNVVFEKVEVIDPFWQLGESAKSSHLIRISHADGIAIHEGSVRRTTAPPEGNDPGVIFAIADSTDIDIGPFTVTCCARHLVSFIEDNDWDGSAPFGNIRDIRFTGLRVSGADVPIATPFQFQTANIAVRNIEFRDLDLTETSPKHLARFKDARKLTGSVLIQGKIGGLKSPLSGTLPESFDLHLDLQTEDGRRIDAARR